MRAGQSLGSLTSLPPDRRVFRERSSGLVFVQGDAAATTAFYHRIAIGHVESGLRTYDRLVPFRLQEPCRRGQGAQPDRCDGRGRAQQSEAGRYA